ncbi:MAG: DEAD/DEAH box helicase family protein [Candidatus Marinimicrobia bacterium]|nr:DEAD/DEAH box helicase family protein [Candidatus Neomarinimicrobiota bacterium]
MNNTFLQNIIEDISISTLPYNWNYFNLEGFSKDKRLWDFQQKAVENAIKVLWKYYEDLKDFVNGEKLEVNQERKKKLFEWYKNNSLEEDLDIRLDKLNRKIYNLLTEYYTPKDGKIPYWNYINRMSFWMATGSGKTLIIIKLIKILKQLMARGEIPEYDILFLTHRNDLIEQFKRMVDEVNYADAEKIELRELKEYPEVKRQMSLFGTQVFYYRSDNIGDEQKEKIIDFRNYDNDGKWYIFLDEAHKGDKEDSKRQHIYSILSRNGFLFNFSATFTDPRDVITAAFEFNLSSFIEKGYGKHISVLRQEIRAFREDEDYSGDEKQKIVLKSLILLTYSKKFYEKISKIETKLYHKPLLLTLVNSINTEDADLKLFFREIERIGKGDIEEMVFKESIDELWEEFFKEETEFVFEDGKRIKIDENIFKGITLKDIWKYVYNSDSPGEIEISFRPSDKKQVAFKLTTSDKHFALSKTGDIPSWLKEELGRFNVNHRFEEEGFFERINQDDSPINILMGSRAFYEGWDSNRPNIINFINIGTGTDAKKFILQSIGRGIRIEPIANKRRRLVELYNNKEIDDNLFGKIKDLCRPLETLFVFGTNRSALLTVIKELKRESKEKGQQISLFVNKCAEKQTLLIPVYKLADYPLMKKRGLAKFEISRADFEILKKYSEYINDDRIFIMNYDTTPEKVRVLRKTLYNSDQYYKYAERSFKNIHIFVQRLFDYFSVTPEELKEFKELDEEIRHFRNIKVYLKSIDKILKSIEMVRDYPIRIKELQSQYGKIPPDEYDRRRGKIKKETIFESDHKKITIKYVANHYYLPLILSDEEKIDYIKHIIKTQSEVNFVNDLEQYLNENRSKFNDFDWWLFSKLDESLDEVYIPYYNPETNRISKFKPDFIFWFKKGDNYFIVFVDPKGTEHTGAYRKIDGYKVLFEENGKEKVFNYNGFKVRIKLLLRPKDISKALDEYKQYWFYNIEKMLKVMA